MAKKQLNLDMPLLSVRRLPSKLSLSSSSDERKSYPRSSSSSRQSSLHNLYTPESDLTQFSIPAAVPFLWEQVPGRPKEEPDAKSECPVESWTSTPPRPPPGRASGELVVERRSMKSQVAGSFPVDKDLSALEIEDDSIQEIFSDALDTLSETESLSFDCSLSRISGNAEERRSNRSSLTDSRTRDFMMRRFLPAAKAMVIDTPTQYVSQKHSGQLDQSHKMDEERISLIKQNQQVKDSEPDEDEDSVDCVDAMKKPARIRGILARFCLRNSLCLLNPVSGMKSRKHVHHIHDTSSPAKEVVRRMSRSSYSGSIPRLYNPHISISQELPVPRRPSASGANRMSFSGEMLMRGGSSQSTFRGNGFVSVPKIGKMFSLDHPLSITRLSQLDKKMSNECFTKDGIEEEIFSQDWNINSRNDCSLGGQVEDGLKSSSTEVQSESLVNRSPLSPPLPKSPSESWLWRAVPTISLKSPFHSHTKKQSGRLSFSSPKWENIVKTSNKHHDHICYSEELIPRISQHSKA